MTDIRAALREGAHRLAGLPSPATDTRLLLAHVLNIDPGLLVAHGDRVLSDAEDAAFNAALDDRLKHRPVSHILGYREFYGRRFTVSDAVLDPRPETEGIVDLALKHGYSRFLDLGTGSGALACSLLAETPDAIGIATDISPEALDVAAANAARLGVAPRLDLRLSDWFETVDGEFDLIVSNPPYIPSGDRDTLDPDVRDWEPGLALFAGSDGLDAYRRIAEGLASHLSPKGIAIFEFGLGQGPDVAAILERTAGLPVTLRSDLSGRRRFALATNSRPSNGREL